MLCSVEYKFLYTHIKKFSFFSTFLQLTFILKLSIQYIGVSMKALSVFAAALALIYTASSNAYVLTEKFVTEHYGVYEAILGKTEIYNDNLEQIMIKDMTARKKFQTTTIVFNYSSKGLSSTIKEPAVSVITTEQYNNTIPATVNISKDNRYATYSGIFVTQKQLSEMANNKTMQPYFLELSKVPLVLSDLEVQSVSRNFENKLFITNDIKGAVFDIQLIDSIFYTKEKMNELKPNCKINVLFITDRATDNYPFMFAGHGALNDMKCTKGK